MFLAILRAKRLLGKLMSISTSQVKSKLLAVCISLRCSWLGQKEERNVHGWGQGEWGLGTEVWLEQQSYSNAVSGFKLLMHVEVSSKSRDPGHIPNQLNQKLWYRLSVCLKAPQ